MDTGWIQVFVLVMTECVAPAGKSVCQEQELRYEFYDKDDCEVVLQQLLAHKDHAENIIVDKEKAACLPTARKQQIFYSLDDANKALSETEGWGQIPVASDALDFTQEEHLKRLGEVPKCDDVGGVAPCKIGEIIVEGASENKSEVWHRADK
jgi:hypothetical protein